MVSLSRFDAAALVPGKTLRAATVAHSYGAHWVLAREQRAMGYVYDGQAVGLVMATHMGWEWTWSGKRLVVVWVVVEGGAQ